MVQTYEITKTLTVLELAAELSIQENTLRRVIRDKGHGYMNGQPLPTGIYTELLEHFGKPASNRPLITVEAANRLRKELEPKAPSAIEKAQADKPITFLAVKLTPLILLMVFQVYHTYILTWELSLSKDWMAVVSGLCFAIGIQVTGVLLTIFNSDQPESAQTPWEKYPYLFWLALCECAINILYFRPWAREDVESIIVLYSASILLGALSAFGIFSFGEIISNDLTSFKPANQAS